MQPRNQKALIKTSIPGPKSQELRKREDAVIAPGLQGFALKAGIVVERAEGSLITDVDGNEFLDMIGGIGVNGLGHSHPRIVKAIQEQVKRVSVGSFTSEARLQLLEKIKDHRLNDDLTRTQLYSSGAEAVESALRLAKAYTKRSDFVSFWGAFHGKTMGVLSLMGSDFKKEYGPFVAGSHQLPYPNPYRPPLSMSKSSCGSDCVEFARKYLKTSGLRPAAIIVEPMQGTAGNIIPPDDFLPGLQSVAKEFDSLLIVDEMITGFGRTGKYWGSEHSGVKPDILTIGKQFGGGFPISAIISSTEITSASPWSIPSGSSSSYGGNPLAAAAAREVLSIIDDEGLVENSRTMGQYFLEKLLPFGERYSFVGEVRGRGLFLGIDLVKDRSTKEPLSKAICAKIFDECLQRGLLTMAYSPSFRIQPAMTIDRGTIDHAVAILEEVFQLMEKEL